jgi:PAS domain S-box-containing protein
LLGGEAGTGRAFHREIDVASRRAPVSDQEPLAASSIDEALFELAPDAILLVEAGGRIVRANARAEVVFGYPRAELVGASIDMLVPEPARAAHEAHRRGYGGQPRTRPMGGGLELRACRKGGGEFPVEVALAPIVTADGPLVLAIVRDVTVRKEAEAILRRAHDELELRVAERTRELFEANRRLVEEHAKLVQAEKLSSIGLLAAGVAHEINNPLSGVMGLVKVLRERRVPDGKRDEYFETIGEGLDRMRTTVQGLLDFARPRAASRTPLDPVAMVGACVRLVTPEARRKGVPIEVVAPAHGRPLVEGDRSQLMQAIVNVLMNALYVAPAGSAVVISVEVEGRRVGIRIADRGPGIPAADLARIGDPFFSTKPEGEGTGLGLAITLGIVRAHRGELAIDTGVGAGTTMTLWLPVSEGVSCHA